MGVRHFVASNGGLHYLLVFMAMFVFSHADTHVNDIFAVFVMLIFTLVFQGADGFFPSGGGTLSC